jgi:aspartate/methionine/tyrosine aminotransferase
MARLEHVSRLKNVPGIGVDLMGNLADAANDSEILRLENLDTDILPPQIALDATVKAITRDESNSYLPFLGQDALRQAATNRVSRVSGISYDWKKQCIITAGGMSGILNCMLATLEPGDEVIVTDPTYAGIINRIHLVGATPVFVPLLPASDGWCLDTVALTNAISPRTRMLLMSPGMPTGHVFTHSEWEAVAEAAIKADAWLLYDAAMERILYDGRNVIHPASFAGMSDRTITVGAASKELRMIGWRVGWVVGSHSIMNDIGLVSMANVVCQTGISMAGVAAGLASTDDGLTDALIIWQQRRDCILNELQGLPVIPPHGGWSMLLNADMLGMTAQELSKKLFVHAKIAATPMNNWGPNAAKYVRLVFSNEPLERLRGIGVRVKKALSL